MKENKLNEKLDEFLDIKGDEYQESEECQEIDSQGKCLIKTDKSIVERINKKILTEDGRELLI